jgi:hypothetical protein
MNDGEAYATFSFADSTTKLLHKVRISPKTICPYYERSKEQIKPRPRLTSTVNDDTVVRFKWPRLIGSKTNLAKDFKVMVSMDGENFSEAYSGTLETKCDFETFEFDPVKAKYVKLMLLNARGENSPYVSIAEFQAFAKPAPARLQVIHNAADPAADTVDVYVNGEILLDDFAFRAATPFIDVPGETLLTIGVAPGTSASAEDALASFDVTLASGETYVVVANGVLDPDSFAVNPDGKATGFTLFVKAGAQEMAMAEGNVEFAVLHGSTDAPTVDVYARDVAQLVDDAAYGDITDYLSVPPADYTLDITDATGTTTVASFLAPLAGLADGAAFVFASGFFDPAANNNGPGFGIFVALPNGDVLELPAAAARLMAAESRAANDAGSLAQLPEDFGLAQNYPNPFNPETVISFQLPEASDVVLNIYNIRGQLINTLVNASYSAGTHQVVWNGQDLSGNVVAGGLYIYKIRASNSNETVSFSRKMMFMK